MEAQSSWGGDFRPFSRRRRTILHLGVLEVRSGWGGDFRPFREGLWRETPGAGVAHSLETHLQNVDELWLRVGGQGVHAAHVGDAGEELVVRCHGADVHGVREEVW